MFRKTFTAQRPLLRMVILTTSLAALPGLLLGQEQAQRLPEPLPARVSYEGSFQRLQDGSSEISLLKRVLHLLVGPVDVYTMVRPFGITTDPQGRIVVVDTEQRLVHVLDYAHHKYLHLAGSPNERFVSPIGTTVDQAGNIYVTDSYLGKIFVFRPNGKFLRFLGDAGGEGIFRRPTGIAFDATHQHLFLTDTLYHKVFELDLSGRILHSFGKRGVAPGEFNYPVAIACRQGRLYVVDAMNFRVQVLDRKGTPIDIFGREGDGSGTFARPKSIALDSEGHIYVVDSLFDAVQVFDRHGNLLLSFGRSGSGDGEFDLPSGIFIDPADRIYVADSYNSRVEVFQYHKSSTAGTPGKP